MPAKFAERVDEFHERAAARAKLTDFGPPSYREGMGVLLGALDELDYLTDYGRDGLSDVIVDTLVARLWTEEGWKRAPEVKQAPIVRPIVITGIPRTGTTALHKLLSMDRQFQGIERWLAAAPQPRPPRDAWEANAAYQDSIAELERFFARTPGMRKAHNMVAGEVDECLNVLTQEFVSNRFGSVAHLPGYDRWQQAQDERCSYARYADVLRLIGAADSRTWLLKNPGHVWAIERVFDVFPDAMVIHTHRTPLKAISSIGSVLLMARGAYEGESADPGLLGPRESKQWSEAMRRTMRARDARPDQFLDVFQADLHRDPMSVVRAVYDRLGLTLSAEAERAMAAWIEADKKAHVEHKHHLREFGVSEQQVRDDFAPYMARFGF